MDESAAGLFDLAVIGGGINGCGIARDAAGRGARVLLLEKGDLAQGTSSASTKLIHGGLRYLEHYEFALVRESLAERERLWRIAPHIVSPMRFVLPHVPELRSRWLLRLGLLLYDTIGGRGALPPTETIDLSRHPAGAPLRRAGRHAWAYSDCWVDDARLVVLNARDAADRGAEVHTRGEVLGLERTGAEWSIRTSDRAFRARAVVNATGPAMLSLLRRADEAPEHRIRLVRGSHIVVPKLFDHPFAYLLQLPDRRIVFAIPYETEFTLIGTTDRDHAGSLDCIEPGADEIDYLCAAANRYFAATIGPDDVVWSFAGVRPLVDHGSGKPEAATRGYRLELSDEAEGAPLLSVFGGKITTYRHLAEEAIALLARRLAVLRSPDWTGGKPLPGGDFGIGEVDRLIEQTRARYPFLEPRTAQRLVRSYGTLVSDVLGDARSLADCGRSFGHGLSEREVRYLQEREWAQTAEDILWRRSKLGLRISPSEAQALASFLDQPPRAIPKP